MNFSENHFCGGKLPHECLVIELNHEFIEDSLKKFLDKLPIETLRGISGGLQKHLEQSG